MKKLICLVSVLLTCSGSIFAQSSSNRTYPKWEFFAGYSREFVNNNDCAFSMVTATGGSVCIARTREVVKSDADAFKPTVPMNGFELSAIYNFHRYMGVKADFSGHFKKEMVVAESARGLSQYFESRRFLQYMMGPELKLRNHSLVTPFGYALLGSSHSVIGRVTMIDPLQFRLGRSSTNNDGLSSAVGGGVDFRMSERTSLRYSIDLNPTRNRQFGSDGATQNNVRSSIGILFR